MRARAPVRAQGAAPARKIDLSFVKIGKVWKEGRKEGRKEKGKEGRKTVNNFNDRKGYLILYLLCIMKSYLNIISGNVYL